MPRWIRDGFQEYAQRLPREYPLYLKEIPLHRRRKGEHPSRQIELEGSQMIASIPKHCYVIALDKGGQQWSTEELAQHLARWSHQGQDLALLIGGPEGLAQVCLERAAVRWSLSQLTFPHALVRIIVAEQLYRAVSLLQGHPYHR